MSATPRQEPSVKGVAFRSVLSALATLRGKDATAQAIARMPADLGETFKYGGIMAPSWYPISWYRMMWKAIREATGEGTEIAHQIGRETMRADMTGIYRLVFKIVSPQTVLSLSTKIFSNYYDSGKLEVLESQTGYARARWNGCRGFDRNMWVEVFGASEMLLELAGAKKLRFHVHVGGRDDDEHAEAIAVWG